MGIRGSGSRTDPIMFDDHEQEEGQGQEQNNYDDEEGQDDVGPSSSDDDDDGAEEEDQPLEEAVYQFSSDDNDDDEEVAEEGAEEEDQPLTTDQARRLVLPIFEHHLCMTQHGPFGGSFWNMFFKGQVRAISETLPQNEQNAFCDWARTHYAQQEAQTMAARLMNQHGQNPQNYC